MNQSKFKPEADFNPGFIANTKEGELSACRFGGVIWSAVGPRPDLGNPTLLVTVNCAAIASSQPAGFKRSLEVPLFSYINLNGIISMQEYQLDHEEKTATFRPFLGNVELLPVKDRLKIPLPEKALRLREMKENEVCKDEKSYWVAIDSFLGGEGVIRLGGEPLYINDIDPRNDDFSYFASVGYESPTYSGGLLGNESFFLGELAYYFFVSSDWKTVRVVSQES